jgi:hypothetical protein
MDQVLPGTLRQVVNYVLESPNLHGMLGVLGLSAHVRHESNVVKLHKTGVHLWLVKENVKTSGTKLVTVTMLKY